MNNFCENCGSPINLETGVCPKCTQSNKVKKRKVIVPIVAVVLAVVIAVGSIIIVPKLKKLNATSSEYTSFSYGFTDVKITDEASVIEAINSVSDVMGITDVDAELKVANKHTIGGDSYYKVQQYYEGIPVYGKTISVAADKEGNGTALTSNYVVFDKKIDIKPSAKQEDIDKSIKKYLEDSEMTVPQIDETQLVIYCDDETNKQKLAYCLFVSSNKKIGDIIVDAKTGDVLAFGSYLSYDSAPVTNKSGTITATGWRNDDGSYHLYNEKYGISVYDFGKAKNTENLYTTVQPNYKTAYKIDTVYSKSNVFSDDAITVFMKMIDVCDYYDSLSFIGFDRISVGYGEKNAIRNNAVGGSEIIDNERNGFLVFGEDRDINAYDLYGHEFSHAVTNQIVNWAGNMGETGAINEGYSDLFGELIEDDRFVTREMDWVHGKRIISDPQLNSYPDSIDDNVDIGKTGGDYSHTYSTVISHAGYLMWNGIDGSFEKIDSKTLAKLWFRTLFLMPSDVNYGQFRNAIELTARIMMANGELNMGQYLTIQRAFEIVGIRTSEFIRFNHVVQNEFDLIVLNHKETSNVSYNLKIYQYMYDEQHLIKEEIINFGECALNMEDGIYVFEITDVYNNNYISEPIIMDVVVDGKNEFSWDEVKVYTDFTQSFTVVLNNETQIPEAKPEQVTESENNESIDLTPEQLKNFENFINGSINSIVYHEHNTNDIDKGIRTYLFDSFLSSPENTVYDYYFPNSHKRITEGVSSKYGYYMSYEKEEAMFVLNEVMGLNVSDDINTDKYGFKGDKFYLYEVGYDGAGDIYTHKFKVDIYEKADDGYYKIKAFDVQQEWGEGPATLEVYHFTVKPCTHPKYGQYWKIKEIRHMKF